MEPIQAGTLAGLLAQTDAVGRLALLLLVAMSLATWYLIAMQAVLRLASGRRSLRFLESFWNAPSMQAVALHLAERGAHEPFSRVARRAIAASRHHQRHGAHRLAEAGTPAEFLSRALRRGIDEETARLERGLTVLASIGSTAPFVGLFGTMWGVYHALGAIGLSGQGTLDKVAGPVGEALIMTAAGLAVAIPAVLAYNTLVRGNRVLLARLDTFADDLFSVLTTGAPLREAVPVAPLHPVPAAEGA